MRNEALDFQNTSLIAKILYERNLIQGTNMQEASNTPEFQIFCIIGQNNVIKTEEIEQKFQSPSLSLMLSNLQADGLIEQTSDYRWKISESTLNTIKQAIIELSANEEISIQNQKEWETRKEKESKKSLYKRISDQLVGTTYLPHSYTIEDLLSIPEVEILVIIYENEPISTHDIEENMTLETSLSLSLSNFQADEFIEQTNDYRWKLTPQFKEMVNLTEEIAVEKHTAEKDDSVYSMHDQSSIIEHRQLLKSLVDMQYFPSLPMKDILDTIEFEILSIIHSNSPITTEDIESQLSQETLLSLQLSNLKADNLIVQENDYRWVLEEEFRTRIKKIKVDQQEILDQLRSEKELAKNDKIQQRINDKGISAKVERPMPISPSPSDSVQPSQRPQTSTKTIPKKLTLPRLLAKKLNEFGYVSTIDAPLSELMNIPEYEIITIISKHQPVSGEQIEEMSSASSVSLTLSNLSADGIVVQTNDYQYVIAEEFDSEIKRLGGWKVEEALVKAKETTITDTGGLDRSLSKNLKTTALIDPDLLKYALHNLGYIPDANLPPQKLNDIPEFEVLNIIAQETQISAEDIKDRVASASPVHISRTLSKLEADRRIVLTKDELWKFSEEFVDLINTTQRNVEPNKRERLPEQKIDTNHTELASAARKLKLINLLQDDGTIPDDTNDLEKLSKIPELEVLWIVSQYDAINEELIKQIVQHTPQELVKRTIVKLHLKGKVEKLDDGSFRLSQELSQAITA